MKTKMLALVVVLASARLEAQSARPQRCTDEPDSVLADRYAPELHFAAGERYFPTLPYFHAFDGIDNNADGSVDLDDSLEIAPLFPDRHGHVGVLSDSLESWYQATVSRSGRPTRAAVFYRVRCLTGDEIDALWRFVSGDHQGRRRFGIPQFTSLFTGPARQWAAIEFYLYYVRDNGLAFRGHVHDTEKIFMFVPGTHVDAARLRIVVGAGHSAVTPNNVLVLTGPNAWKPSLVHALVELGGHAMAPDLPPYGSFIHGHDANWYAGEDTWGTRDIMAISGRGSANDFEPWKVMPRDPLVSTSLRPAHFGQPAGDSLYALLHDTLLSTLFRLGATGALNVDSATVLLGDLERRLGWGHFIHHTGGASHLEQAVVRMRGWRTAVNDAEGDHHAAVVERIWPMTNSQGDTVRNSGDEEYVFRPTSILKARLYRGAGYSLGPETGFDVARGGTVYGAVGLGFPIPSLAGIYLRGLLNVQAGVRAPRWDHDRAYLAFALQYDAHHYRAGSWYARLEHVAHRDLLEERSVTNMAVTFGLTFRVPTASRRSSMMQLSRYKLRFGLRANLSGRGFDLGRVTPEIGLATNLLDVLRDY